MEADDKFRMIKFESVKELDKQTNITVDNPDYIKSLFANNSDFLFDGNMAFMVGKYVSSFL